MTKRAVVDEEVEGGDDDEDEEEDGEEEEDWTEGEGLDDAEDDRAVPEVEIFDVQSRSF